MRFLGFLVLATTLALSAAPVRADRLAEPEPETDAEPRQTFWEWIADPAARDVQVILEKTNAVVRTLEDATEDDIPAETLATVHGMLRYGLSRSPDNADLLVAMGRVADAMGRGREAAATLEHLQRVAPDHFRAGEAQVLLANILAQLGDDARAERVFQGIIARPNRPRVREAALIGMAWLHMRAGRADRAVDLLDDSRGIGLAAFDRSPLPQLVLAIALDRDGQLTRAHQVVTDLTKVSPLLDLLTQHAHTLASMRLLEPLDRHYVSAFTYEIAGLLPDALAEWQLYARASEAPYRARAREHARELTALLRAANKKKVKP